MKRNRIIIFAALAVALLPCRRAGAMSPDSLCRKMMTFNEWCSPEKLYVHLDRTYFSSGETIWFNGYLRNASPLARQKESEFIYAEVLDKTGSAVLRVKVKRTDGTYPGSIYIPEDLSSGDYTFRAYSLWQLNSPAEFMFNQKIKILGSVPPEKKNAAASSKVDVSFYPEGGRYFNGVNSVIGFKVMDSEGRSADMSGFIYDDKDQPVTPVVTSYDGMGRFSFVPEAGVSYYLRDEYGRKFELPSASENGGSVGTRSLGEDIVVSVNGRNPGTYTLLVRNSQGMLPLIQVPLDGKTRAFKMGKEFTAPGINHVILADSLNHIISERLFFVYDKTAPKCSVTSVNSTHTALKPVSAAVGLTAPDGSPLNGNFSVSVSRGSFKQFQQNDGVVSYMMLSSELKGHINNPGFYFDEKESERRRAGAMDLLMSIQGWRYYDLETIADPAKPLQIEHLKEYTQTVTGKITNAPKGKVPTKFIFSVLIPKKKFSRFIKVDKAEAFTLDSLDFEENTEFLISITKSGIGREYAPRWSGDTFAGNFKYGKVPGRTGAVAEDEKLPLVYEGVAVDTLQAAVVTASNDDPFTGAFGGTVVSQEEMMSFKDYNLIQYLIYKTPRFEFDGENMYNRMFSRGAGSNGISEEAEDVTEMIGTEEGGVTDGLVKLIADGDESPWWTYEYVPVEELASISISTMPDSFYNSSGGLVTIRLKPGATIKDVSTRKSLLYFVPLGYQKPKAFYSPRYDKGDVHDVFDHRNTVFWSPSVNVKDGRASVVFCDTDQMDYPYIVRIEGMTEAGQFFSCHSVIE